MKRDISKKHVFYLLLLPFVSIFGATPPPIGDAPNPPGFPIDGAFLLITLALSVVFGIYKLNLKIAKD